jgi:hypothetical protein
MIKIFLHVFGAIFDGILQCIVLVETQCQHDWEEYLEDVRAVEERERRREEARRQERRDNWVAEVREEVLRSLHQHQH